MTNVSYEILYKFILNPLNVTSFTWPPLEGQWFRWGEGYLDCPQFRQAEPYVFKRLTFTSESRSKLRSIWRKSVRFVIELYAIQFGNKMYMKTLILPKDKYYPCPEKLQLFHPLVTLFVEEGLGIPPPCEVSQRVTEMISYPRG